MDSSGKTEDKLRLLKIIDGFLDFDISFSHNTHQMYAILWSSVAVIDEVVLDSQGLEAASPHQNQAVRSAG